jgi:hypothetical protein
VSRWGPDRDVLESGREPSGRPGRARRLTGPLILALTAALVGSVAIGLHYRAQAARVSRGRPAVTSGPVSPPVPQMTSTEFRLPADGPISGKVVITAASQPGAVRGQFAVSAIITGGRPDTQYQLTGGDCSAVGLPDATWAAGRTNAAGTAELAGHPWTGLVTDEYWLALDPSPLSPPPGLHGTFGVGLAGPFPAGRAPCDPGSGQRVAISQGPLAATAAAGMARERLFSCAVRRSGPGAAAGPIQLPLQIRRRADCRVSSWFP